LRFASLARGYRRLVRGVVFVVVLLVRGLMKFRIGCRGT
jgi:hypothetical protein